MGRGGSNTYLPSSQSINKVTRALKRERNSLFNCLNSIIVDASFVNELAGLYPGTPLFANLRCGLWYTQNPDATCYFKSTDGHAGAWKFSKIRLNWHVAEVAAAQGSCMIVDATRKGKRFPDALSKTIPIWAAVINRAVARFRAAHPPPPPPALASFEEPDFFVDATQCIIPDVGSLPEPEPWATAPSPEPCLSPRLNTPPAAGTSDTSKPFTSHMSLKEWLFEEQEASMRRNLLTSEKSGASVVGTTVGDAAVGRAALSPGGTGQSSTSQPCAVPPSSSYETRSAAVPVAEPIGCDAPLSSSPFTTLELDLPADDLLAGVATPRMSASPTATHLSTPASTPASFAFLSSSPSSVATPTPDMTTEEVEAGGAEGATADVPEMAAESAAGSPAESPAESEWDIDLHLPLWVPHNERQQIEALLDGWVDELMELGVDIEGLAQTLKKPLRPLWLSPMSVIWLDQVCRPADLPFTPLILVSASVPREERKELPLLSLKESAEEQGSDGTFSYVPGAGDDEESWACGLTPGLFWKHHQELLRAGPSGVKSVAKSLVAAAPASERSGVPRPLAPANTGDEQGLSNLKPMGCETLEGIRHTKTDSGIYWIGNSGIAIGNFEAGAPPTVWTHVDSVLNCGSQQHPTFVDMVTCMTCKLGDDPISPTAATVPSLWASSSCSLGYNPYPSFTSHPSINSTQYSSSPPINIRYPSTWHLGHRSHRLAACLNSGALVDDVTDHDFGRPGGGACCGSCGQQAAAAEPPAAADGNDTLWEMDADEAHSPGHAAHTRDTHTRDGHTQKSGQPHLHTNGAGGGTSTTCGSAAVQGNDTWHGHGSCPERGVALGATRSQRCISNLGSSYEDSRSVDYTHELFSSHVSGTSNSSGSVVSGTSVTGSPSQQAGCGARGSGRPRPSSCPNCKQIAQTMAGDRYLWLPILSSKHDRTDLAEKLDDAVGFIWRAVTAGKKVLIHDDDGLDTAVCVAVAALLAFYDAPDTTSCSRFTLAIAPQWRPLQFRVPNPFVSTEEITKQTVRRRLAVVSALYPPARPTRGMLKQVFRFFHPEQRPEGESP